MASANVNFKDDNILAQEGKDLIWEILNQWDELLEENEFLSEKLEGERMTKESFKKSFDIATEVARGMIDEERKLPEKVERERNQAEYDRDYNAEELDEERVLRSHLEDVNEYYEKQIRKNCIFDGERIRDFGRAVFRK